MANKTVQLIANMEKSEVDLYAKTIPELFNELADLRRQLEASKLSSEQTKGTLERIYKDYNKEVGTSYKLVKDVKFWKIVSTVQLGLLLFLLTLLIIGAC